MLDQVTKVLLKERDPSHVEMRGIFEYSLEVTALSLSSALRLFARLNPLLSTAKSKDDFINAVLPKGQEHAASAVAQDILHIFADGYLIASSAPLLLLPPPDVCTFPSHPAGVMRLATEIDTEAKMEELCSKIRIIRWEGHE